MLLDFSAFDNLDLVTKDPVFYFAAPAGHDGIDVLEPPGVITFQAIAG
jgi:hypothetical protein